MERLAWPSGGGGAGGFTISEEGGLEEVLEFLRAPATFSCSSATLARSASISACWAFSCPRKRSQLAQRECRFMEHDYMRSCIAGQKRPFPVNGYQLRPQRQPHDQQLRDWAGQRAVERRHL